jgi:hypothetical protein
VTGEAIESKAPRPSNSTARVIHILAWLVVFGVAAYSTLDFVMTSPESAPQQGALGALCAARVVIAYVFARALDELGAKPGL